MAMDGRILRERRPDVLQLGFLLIPRDGDASAAIRSYPLFESGGGQDATQATHALKFPLLSGTGIEFVLEGLAHCPLFHSLLFCLIAVKSAIELGRTGPALSP